MVSDIPSISYLPILWNLVITDSGFWYNTTEIIILPEDLKSKEQILKAFNDNPLLWGMYFCPHHFRGPSPAFHLRILKECLTNRFLAVAAPRESAKSTILAFLIPLHAICFRKKRFILIVSNTYKKASGSLDSIKKEFKDNQKVKETFGVLKVPKNAVKPALNPVEVSLKHPVNPAKGP